MENNKEKIERLRTIIELSQKKISQLEEEDKPKIKEGDWVVQFAHEDFNGIYKVESISNDILRTSSGMVINESSNDRYFKLNDSWVSFDEINLKLLEETCTEVYV